MKQALFWTFLLVFVATALVTLLGISGQLLIREEYLTKLFYLLIVEVIAAMVGLFKKTEFFPDQPNGPTASEKIYGCWWELIHNHSDIALSFVQIRYSAGQREIEMTGEAYNSTGKRVARWSSLVTHFKRKTLELLYIWEGDDFLAMNKDCSGYGQCRFRLSANTDEADSGSGWYTSSNISGLKFKVEMKKVPLHECETMLHGDSEAKGGLASSVHTLWRKNLPDTR